MITELKSVLRHPIRIPRPRVGQILRWMISFLAIDFFFLWWMSLGCIAEPDLCGVGAVFLVAGFYYPYGILLPDLGAVNGLSLSTYVAPVLGFMTHAALGALIGHMRRGKSDSWWVTVPVGIAVVLALTLLPSMAIIFSQPPLATMGN